jgi:hypothetical protein
MTSEHRTLTLQYVKAGLGRYAALEQLGMTYAQFRQELQNEPEFRNEIIMSERQLEQQCMSVIFEDAIQNTCVSSAALYVKLARDDRHARARDRMELRKLKLAGKLTDHATADERSISFRGFNLDEVNDCSYINAKLLNEEELTTEEAVRFAKYMSRAWQPQEKAIAGGSNMKQIGSDVGDDDWD